MWFNLAIPVIVLAAAAVFARLIHMSTDFDARLMVNANTQRILKSHLSVFNIYDLQDSAALYKSTFTYGSYSHPTL